MPRLMEPLPRNSHQQGALVDATNQTNCLENSTGGPTLPLLAGRSLARLTQMMDDIALLALVRSLKGHQCSCMLVCLLIVPRVPRLPLAVQESLPLCDYEVFLFPGVVYCSISLRSCPRSGPQYRCQCCIIRCYCLSLMPLLRFKLPLVANWCTALRTSRQTMVPP